MPSIIFDLATEADDAALRQLLRDTPMPGSISVTFEREPSYFVASAVEGDFHQTIVARETETGQVAGMGSRSVRPMYVNGVVQPVGYMSQLRATASYGWGLQLARAIAKGFEFSRALHADGRAPFYLMSVTADNLPARRLLASGLTGLPCLRKYARFYTYAVYASRRQRPLPLPRGLRLERGRAQHLQAILDCLQRNGARQQFAPCWTAKTLFNPRATPGLTSEDFSLALDGERVVGCVACWDQGGFKQTVVRSYSGVIARWRKVINLAAPLGGWPTLPDPHTPLRHCYASHLAIDNDDPSVFAALLRALYNHTVERHARYFMLGLSETNPFCAIAKTYRPITYASQLYLVAWDDGSEAVSKVDARVPGPEVAVL